MHGHIQKDYKKLLTHRLKIMQGQMTGLMKAVEDEAYCVDVLNQSSAIQESLKSFDALMLENHLRTHVKEQFRGKHPEHAVSELVKIFTYGRK